MESITLLKDCLNKTTTVKKAFAHLGLSKDAGKDESIKTMDEETEFACLMNWILNQMPNDQRMTIRVKAQGVHEVLITKRRQLLEIESLVLITEKYQNFVLYEWDEETTYRTLMTKKVEEAIIRADIKNNVNKAAEDNHSVGVAEEGDNETVKITDEDLEFINEFLEA